jgi:hypothetical protein
MKTILLLLIGLFIGFYSNGQIVNETQYPNLFAQGMLNIPQQEMRELQDEMRLNPFLQVVRLDHNSNRFFLLIQNLEEVNEEALRSWFFQYSEFVSCVQIGVHGIDAVDPFPFTNCTN